MVAIGKELQTIAKLTLRTGAKATKLLVSTVDSF